MSDSYLAPGPAPHQLDIIADTALGEDLRPRRKNAPRLSTRSAQDAAPRLSTGEQGVIALRSSTAAITRIEARRVRMKISIRDLCAAARIRIETYDDARLRRCKTRAKTIRRLEIALNQLTPGHTEEARKTLCLVSLRSIQIQLSLAFGLDPDVILALDFSSECSNDLMWRQGSRVRRFAMYILVEGIEAIGKAEIAHALGNITRQGVHKAIATAERERMSDEKFDREMHVIINRLKGSAL